MISKKYDKVCITLNYIEHLLILSSVMTGCIPISAFAPLVGIPAVITSSVTGLKICAITAAVKKYKSIIKKKRSPIK